MKSLSKTELEYLFKHLYESGTHPNALKKFFDKLKKLKKILTRHFS